MVEGKSKYWCNICKNPMLSPDIKLSCWFSSAENDDNEVRRMRMMIAWMMMMMMMMMWMRIMGRCYLLNIGYAGRYITPWLAILPPLLLCCCYDYADTPPPRQIHAQSGPKYGQISMAAAIVIPLFATNCHIYGNPICKFFPKSQTDVCGGGFMPVFRQLRIRMQAWVIPGMFEPKAEKMVKTYFGLDLLNE